MNEEEIALENLVKFVDLFQTQPLILQITILLFLTGVTVGAIIFSYYMIKLVVMFFIKLIKGGVTVVKAGVQYRSSQPAITTSSAAPAGQSNIQYGQGPQAGIRPTQHLTQNQTQHQTQHQTQKQAPFSQPQNGLSTNLSAVNKQGSQPKVPVVHCSNCGNPFTEKMIDALKQSEKVYCEFCGQGFIIEKQ